MMRVGEVARRLDVSGKTVYRLIASGSLGAHRIGGEYRVSEQQLHAYLESTVVGGPAATPAPLPSPPRPAYDGGTSPARSGPLSGLLDRTPRPVPLAGAGRGRRWRVG